MKTLVKKQDGFDVYFEALPEYELHMGLFEPEDKAEVSEKINSGELVLFCAKVSAEKAGVELGSDYLGQCIYECEKDFYTKYENDYFADMVQNVLAEAKLALISLIQELQNS